MSKREFATPNNKKTVYLLLGVTATLAVIGFVTLPLAPSPQLTLFESNSLQEDRETQNEYVQFLAKYGKVQASKEETIRRYQVFKDNLRVIKAHNALESAPFDMEVNWFADMSDYEVEQQITQQSGIKRGSGKIRPFTVEEVEREEALYINNGLNHPYLQQTSNPVPDYNATIPQYKNWFTEGKVSIPGNQMTCGSCWAFTATAVMESYSHLYGNDTTLQQYSVQQLVDCDDEFQSGCSGGWMWQAYNYTKYHGIALKNVYPRAYANKQMKCVYDPNTMSYFKPANMGMIERDRNVNAVLKRLVSQHPIAIAMYAAGMMSKYKSGVMTEDFLKCSTSANEVNHGITLVGYGKVQRNDRVRGHCREYWIIRNSWGPSWGEQGTFRLCMDGVGTSNKPFGSCLVNKFATWPNFSGIIIQPED